VRCGTAGGTSIPTTKELEVTYWPVGHGLFCSADIRYQDAVFTVIYDCGRVGNRHSGARRHLPQIARRPIDLLVISHFHEDHISAIPALLDHTGGAQRVWVPYLSPAMRLLTAAGRLASGRMWGEPPSEYGDAVQMGLDPDGWFRARGASDVHQIGSPLDEEMRSDELPRYVGPPEETQGRGNAEHRDRSVDLDMTDLARVPDAFRARSAFRASSSRVRPAPADGPGWTEEIALFLTWVLPRTDSDIRSAMCELPGPIAGILRDMLPNTAAYRDPPLQARRVTELADAICDVDSRRTLRQFYRALNTELNATSLFLMIQAAAVLAYPEATPINWGFAGSASATGAQTADGCAQGEWPPVPLGSAPDAPSGDVGEGMAWLPSGPYGEGDTAKLVPTLLWSGDATRDVQRRLLADAKLPLKRRLKNASIWQVPHHGSPHSQEPDMHDAVWGAEGVISYGTASDCRPTVDMLQRPGMTPLVETSQSRNATFRWR